jgi:hypothetical protein
MDFVRRLFPLVILLLSGCAGWKPYAEFGVGYQIEDQTDYWIQQERNWQCSRDPEFIGEIGAESPNRWSVSLEHESWVRCGGPFNRDPEVYSNRIKISKKFGGQK